MDALLGAAALGDIGIHFPPTDKRFAGASSLDLLRRVVTLLQGQALRVRNVDLTLIAERPRIGPRSGEMRRALAEAMGIETGRVSVKATTNEGLGFVGRGEGIAAIAVAELIDATSDGVGPVRSSGSSPDG
jgi:2-C-methyl-D-erythritol 2,4-cyclodiphosphate synthase